MPIAIIPTKIIIPKRQPGVVRRPRLIDFLHENLARKLVLITAPAGYGKTTLLIDFASDVDFPVCWFTLDEGDRDPSTFLTHLVAAIRQKFPHFGERSMPLIEQGVPSAHATAAALVGDMVADVPEYFVLVLDDWHFVGDEAAIRDLIDHLLRYLPEHAHVIVAGRTLLRGPLIRLAAQSAVAGIGPNDLRFKADEVREVLATKFNLTITPEQAVKLADEAEGWITAILLTSQSVWQNLLAGLTHIRDMPGTLYEYLAGEVFDRLEPPLQQFLLASAVPHQFTADVCDDLRGADGSERWIEQAEARNLFLTRVEVGGERWYRYHHLFREFLQARFKRDDPVGLRQLQLRAADMFEARQQVEQAIEHYLAAGAPDRAARLMDGIARSLFVTGRRQTLRHWTATLPIEYHAAAPELILYEGQALIERGQLHDALSMLSKAEVGFRARDDRIGQLRATVPQGWVHYALGKFQAGLQIGQQVLRQIETHQLQEPILKAEALRLTGDNFYGIGQWQAAEAHLTQALTIYRHTPSDERRAYNLGRTLQDLANVLRLMGRLEEAATVQAESLTLWRGIGNPDPLARCLNNMGYDRYMVGDYEGALTLYAEALAKAEEAENRQVQAQVLDGIAAAHRDRGEFHQAIDLYPQVFSMANEIGDQALVSWALDGLGHAYRLAGELDRAMALFEQACNVAERNGITIQAQFATASIGITKVEQGAVAAGIADLEQSAQALRGSDSHLDLARVLLWLARSYYLSNQPALAVEHLNEMVRLGNRLGCRPFSLAEGRRALFFLAWGAAQYPALNRLADWLNDVRAEVPSTIEVSAERTATPHIEVRAFGAGIVRRDGQTLSSVEWGGSANARELFLCLLERSPQRKDEIGETFWPRLSPGRMTSSFHAAKYKARRALGVEFAVYEGEAYRINPTADIWYDVAEFKRTLDSAYARSVDDPARITELQQVVTLYSGHYLSDVYSEWTAPIREALQTRYFGALTALINAVLYQQQFDQALALCQRGLELDYFREDLHRTVMWCLVELGQVTKALAHFDKMARSFQTDLKTQPGPETLALVKRIRAIRATKTGPKGTPRP